MSVEELRELLAQLPPRTTVLDPRGTQTLIERLSRWHGAPGSIALDGIDTADGLQPEEVIRLTRTLGLDPRQRISRARFGALTRGFDL